MKNHFRPTSQDDPPRPEASGEGTGAARGRYLQRHRARVIEQGNVVVVEFVDQPWYTEARRKHGGTERPWYIRQSATRPALSPASASAAGVFLPVWQVALLWGVSLSALTVGLLRWM